MFKKASALFGAFLLMISLVPTLDVQAESNKVVNSQDEFKQALSDESITTITLGKDIETTEKINIMRPVVIDGNHHTMKYVGTFGSSGSKDNTVWGGIYVLQVYKTTATIRNIKLTGGNAALLINGANVTLEGTIDVSGNGFGGIELGQGVGVNSSAHIILNSNTNLVNTTETPDKPTIWVPKDSTNSILEVNGVQQVLTADQEISLQEIQELLTPENPETSDSLVIYVVIGLLGIGLFMIVSNKQLRKKLSMI